MTRTRALAVLNVLFGDAKRQLATFVNSPTLAQHSPKTIKRLTDESDALAVAIRDIEAAMDFELSQ